MTDSKIVKPSQRQKTGRGFGVGGHEEIFHSQQSRLAKRPFQMTEKEIVSHNNRVRQRNKRNAIADFDLKA